MKHHRIKLSSLKIRGSFQPSDLIDFFVSNIFLHSQKGPKGTGITLTIGSPFRLKKIADLIPNWWPIRRFEVQGMSQFNNSIFKHVEWLNLQTSLWSCDGHSDWGNVSKLSGYACRIVLTICISRIFLYRWPGVRSFSWPLRVDAMREARQRHIHHCVWWLS